MTTTLNVNHEQLLDLIVHCYERGRPLFVWGAPGIGKSWTERVACDVLAEKLGLNGVSVWPERKPGAFWLLDWRISQMDPVDWRGMPHASADGFLEWLPPAFLNLPRDGKGIILLDEFNLAPPLVQASAYQFIYDRRSGDVTVPDGFGIMACGNRTEDNGGTFEMAKPLLNRFLHVQLDVPDSEAWLAWGAQNHIDGRILGFIEQNPTYLFVWDDDPEVRAFPTPRTWQFASELIRGVDDWARVQTYTSTAVGPAVAAQLAAFARLVQEFDLNKILDSPKSAKLPTEIDRIWAMVTSLAERYRGKKAKTVLAACMVVAGRLDPEFGVLLLKMLKRHAGNGHFAEMTKLLQEYKLTEKFVKYLL